MRLFLIGLAVLVFLIGGTFIVGMLLPQGHVARSTARFAHSSDSVWAIVRDLGGYAEWWPNVKRMERIPDREFEAWRQVDQRNGVLPMEVIAEEAPTRLVTRIIDEGMPFGGTWTYEVAAEGEGARLTITEDGAVYNPFFRFVSRFFMGHHATMDGYLEALGAHLGDEHVVPEHL